MNAQANAPLVIALKEFSRWNGKLIALSGTVVLLGWLIRSEVLMRISPGLVAMNPLTALCFVVAGLSLACFWATAHAPSPFRSRFGQMLAALLIGAGLLKLADYFLGGSFGLDQLLFRERLETDPTGQPNRMAPNTALNFLVSGIALLTLNSPGGRGARLVQILSFFVAFNSVLALLGYVYGANYLYGVGAFIPMALHTAGLFLLLSLGLLFARPHCGAMAVLVGDTPGGVTARRLLPVAFLVPAALGALQLWGARRGLVDDESGATLMVVATIAAFIALIWANTVLLNRADALRRKAEADLRQAHDDLEIRVEERTRELVALNEALRTQIAEREKAEHKVREQAEEKQKLEKQFLRSQRMESIGALAGGIAHDLNNALAPILMCSQLLQTDGDDKAERDDLLEVILGSTRRCTDMVRQILSFARGSGGQVGPVQLRHLIAEMTKIAGDTFPKFISIRSDVPKGLWDIDGDATELHQVLMNLCVNARDAMPEGGQLTLAAENVVLAPEAVEAHADVQPGPFVALRIADTGTGMPPETLARMFEPFFTTKAPDKGTGLGLSTVAGIVKRHRGFLLVRSEVGKGTEFKLFLPATGFAAEQEATPKVPVLPIGRGELIMIVDDEASVRELVKTTLENYSYRVLTAANGLEAIACFEAHKRDINLVMTDNDMPLMDGINAIYAIQQIDPSIPIILASGTRRDTESLRRIDTTLLFKLNKPYDVEQLLNSVAQALVASGRESPLQHAPLSI